MLQVYIHTPKKDTLLGEITPDKFGGSLTDYTNPKTEILLFFCAPDDTGQIMLSKAGITFENSKIRALVASEYLVVEKRLAKGESYSRAIKNKQGETVQLIFKQL